MKHANNDHTYFVRLKILNSRYIQKEIIKTDYKRKKTCRRLEKTNSKRIKMGHKMFWWNVHKADN